MKRSYVVSGRSMNPCPEVPIAAPYIRSLAQSLEAFLDLSECRSCHIINGRPIEDHIHKLPRVA